MGGAGKKKGGGSNKQVGGFKKTGVKKTRQGGLKKPWGFKKNRVEGQKNWGARKKKAGRPEGLHEDWPTADTLSNHNGRHRALSFSP